MAGDTGMCQYRPTRGKTARLTHWDSNVAHGVRLSEGRGQNNQHQMTTISKWWYSSVVLVYDLHRGMCCKPSGKVQEGREGLLMENICDW